MTRAFYPGSFDPPTCAHFDLARRAREVFGGVTVGIGRNSRKSPVLTEDDRVGLMRDELTDDGVPVEVFEGLVINHCLAKGYDIIVRGVRNGDDLAYELQMVFANRALAPGVETVFLTPALGQSFISSSLIKEILLGGGDVSPYLTPAVADRLRERLQD